MSIPTDEEIARLQKAVKNNPGDAAQQIWLLAAVVKKRGLATAGVDGFREIVGLRREWPELHFKVLRYWADNGASLPALEQTFRTARESARSDAIVVYGHGLLLQTGRPAAAIEAFEAAMKLDRSLAAAAHHNIGVIHNIAGRRDAAMAAFRSAIAASATIAEPHYALAGYLFKIGQRREAREHMERFLELVHSDLAEYVPTVEMSLQMLNEKEGRGPYYPFQNRLRRSDGRPVNELVILTRPEGAG